MKVVDLFAGCGGLTLGFQNAGFEIVVASDNWKASNAVYSKNFKHQILELDLSNVKLACNILNEYAADMIIGGPPCQDFSHAGKRNEDNGRGDLTISFAKIISQLKPKYFVMENVERLVKTMKYKEAVRIFKQKGYGLTVKLLDASYCGVPQKRKRYFVIGVLGGEDNALEKYLIKNLDSKPMTIREYLGNDLGTEYYYRHPRNYERRGIYSIDEPSATIRGVSRPVPKGYPGHRLDATKDLLKVRPLTTIERSYIQTFPKGYIWEGSKTDIEQMIGNAVPVKLAQYVASAIKEFIKSHTKKATDFAISPAVQLQLEDIAA